MLNFDNFKPEFTCIKPVRISVIGSMMGLYVSKLISQSYLFDKKFTYPLIVEHQGKMKLAYFLEKPSEYNEAFYKIYRIDKKKKGISTYLPVPTSALSVLGGSPGKKRPFVSYSIGFSNKLLVILLERV